MEYGQRLQLTKRDDGGIGLVYGYVVDDIVDPFDADIIGLTPHQSRWLIEELRDFDLKPRGYQSLYDWGDRE